MRLTEDEARAAIERFTTSRLGVSQPPEIHLFHDGRDGWGWYFFGDDYTTSYVDSEGGIHWYGNRPHDGCACDSCQLGHMRADL